MHVLERLTAGEGDVILAHWAEGDDAEQMAGGCHYDYSAQTWRDGHDHAHEPGEYRWDEPTGAGSPRGWLMGPDGCVGFYLDYGPENYRPSHKYCEPAHRCRECEPGNVLAAAYPFGANDSRNAVRWCPTVQAARAFVSMASAGRELQS